jgi:hypothetical protein
MTLPSAQNVGPEDPPAQRDFEVGGKVDEKMNAANANSPKNSPHRPRMRGCLLIVICGLLAACGLAAGASYLSNHLLPSRSPVTDRLGDLDKARLAEAIHLRHELGDELWPGWGGTDIPMIAYNEEYAFLIGYPDPPALWTTIPNREARGSEWEALPDDTFDGRTYYRQKLLSPDSSPQAFAVLVGGRWVSSMSAYDWLEIRLGEEFQAQVPPALREVFPYRIAGRLFLSAAGGKDWYICASLHESFHAFVGSVNPDRLFEAETSFNGNRSRYPWNDDVFAADWQAELDLLADAVQAETDAETVELAGQFLAQREQRRTEAGLDADLIALERGKEWEEGLAKYTELSIWRLAAGSAEYSPLPAMAGDPGFHSYAGFPDQWTQQVAQIRRMARDEGDTRFYYSGLAQAVLLDRLAPDWKLTVLTGDASLEELLEAAIG